MVCAFSWRIIPKAIKIKTLWKSWNYQSDPHDGSLGYEGFHDWELLQGRYALCLLFEYAATLGLIDVAYVAPAGVRRDFRSLWGTEDLDFLSRYDRLLYFRLNPLAAYYLGLAEA